MNNLNSNNKAEKIAELTNRINDLIEVNQQLTQKIAGLEEANAALQSAQKKAVESEKLKTAFLQNMSHEIRTPMNGILGFSQLLSNPELSDDERQSYLEIVTKSSNRMLNTFSNLMEVSMIETDTVPLHFSTINLNGVFGDLYADFKDEAGRKNLSLRFYSHLPDNDANIYTDGAKLSSILAHLIKNAVKYSDRRGEINFGYAKKDNWLEFYVQDNGKGIPKERHQVVFQKFISSKIDDKNALEGSGLGLTVAKAYVELLGGKMWLESSENKGATFYFTIPYKIHHDDMLTGEEAMAPAKSHKPKILIAEDEPYSKDYLTIILENMCSKIMYADNGLDAVNICRKNPDIDLILMDIRMPQMDGYEATREIRKFNKDIVIIAQTAFAMPGDREKALDAGCNNYISKPINRDELVTIIEKSMPQSV